MLNISAKRENCFWKRPHDCVEIVILLQSIAPSKEYQNKNNANENDVKQKLIKMVFFDISPDVRN